MKREELLNETARIEKMYEHDDDQSVALGARLACGELRGFIRKHLPANSITLTLPVYAPGDPKAGEVVATGQSIHTEYDPDDGPLIRSDVKVSRLVVDDGEILPACLYQDGAFAAIIAVRGPYYSTPEARDAAMEAAKDVQ